MRLLDPRFRYVPAARTDVLATWRRFGFRPTTDSERRARQRQSAAVAAGNGRSAPPQNDLDLAALPAPLKRRAKPNLTLAR